MSTTLLEIGKAIAIKAGLPVQTTLIGNSERTATLILQSIQDGARKDAHRDHDWSILSYTETFTTNGSGYYNLPGDFDRLVSKTVWDRTNDRPLVGPVAAVKWHRYESGLTGLTGLQRIFRIAGKVATAFAGADEPLRQTLRVYPDDASSTTPNAAADPIEVSYEYIGTLFIRRSRGFAQILTDRYESDNDFAYIDSDVIEAAALWRLLRALGMSYSDEAEEYHALLGERKANDAPAETLDMRGEHFELGPNIPETGYGG